MNYSGRTCGTRLTMAEALSERLDGKVTKRVATKVAQGKVY